MTCSNCNKNEAPIHPTYGVIHCQECCDSYKPVSRGTFEFTTDEIKQGRREHRTQLLQPFRSGIVSKEYLDAYPKAKSGMIKEGIITDKQARNARKVWFNDNV